MKQDDLQDEVDYMEAPLPPTFRKGEDKVRFYKWLTDNGFSIEEHEAGQQAAAEKVRAYWKKLGKPGPDF